MTRKLARIECIDDIQPIEGADRIEVLTVGGWKVVAQKGQGYEVGSRVAYFEIDSFISNDLAPFLTKPDRFPKEFEGVRGERLRTIKLRGQISQGLLLPLTEITQYLLTHRGYTHGAVTPELYPPLDSDLPTVTFEVGEDLTEALGIKKWEAPVPGQLQGAVEGQFPTALVSKTDEERVQNLWRDIQKRDPKEIYEGTLKLDGASCTVILCEGKLRVCSRNWELKIPEDGASDNSYIQQALVVGERLRAFGLDDVAVQGELMGPGIQGNREKLKEVQLFVFRVWNLRTHQQLSPDDKREFCVRVGLKQVPTVSEGPLPGTLEELLRISDETPSIGCDQAEGIVYQSLSDPHFHFKAIANSFLVREK